MSKKIEIPLEKKIIQFVMVKFPKKCVYCGIPEHTTLPLTITRTIRHTSQSEHKYNLSPFHIPYCEQHFEEIKAIDARIEKIMDNVGLISFVGFGIIMLPFLYKPFYNWAFDGLEGFYQSFLRNILSFISAVTIVFLISLFITAFISFLLEKILPGIMKPPRGLKIEAMSTLMILNFENEQIADEFLELNSDLSAREINPDIH